MTKDLPSAFHNYGRSVLKEFPEVGHTWLIEAQHCELAIPASSPNGFDIEVEVEQQLATVSWGIWHSPFGPEAGIDQLVEELFGLLRDMLTSDMRVRELWAGGSPYRGYLESFDGETWNTEYVNGSVFWNYFGKRTEHIYSNDVLSPRMQTLG